VLDGRLDLIVKVFTHLQEQLFDRLRRVRRPGDPEDMFQAGEPEDNGEPPFPFDPEALKRDCLAIAEEHLARLKPRLARFEEDEADDRADLPRRCSFDDSAEGERVHRYQTHWSRSLLRTLAAIEKQREATEVDETPAGPSPVEIPTAPDVRNEIAPNKATAEETTPGSDEVCVENPVRNKATEGIVGASVETDSGGAKGDHAERERRESGPDSEFPTTSTARSGQSRTRVRGRPDRRRSRGTFRSAPLGPGHTDVSS
jgi:hypothetical protein